MKNKKHYEEIGVVIIKLVRNFPTLVWKVGLTEIMTQYVELCGEKYGSKNLMMFRKLEIFSDRSIDLLIDFEKILLQQLKNEYPYWIALTLTELQVIENARQLIIEELDSDNKDKLSVS